MSQPQIPHEDHDFVDAMDDVFAPQTHSPGGKSAVGEGSGSGTEGGHPPTTAESLSYHSTDPLLGALPLSQSLVPPVAPRNIVFFGETGVGKSAIINMLREGTPDECEVGEATVSNAALGCTLVSTKYPCTIGNNKYLLWDTAGLVEGDYGKVTAAQAEGNLVALLRGMGGVSLLVYCIRGRRYRPVVKDHYDLFCDKTCRRRVPTLLVVTGLENEENMEDWWARNQEQFTEHGVSFHASVCITSTRGKAIAGGHVYDVEYEQSVQLLRQQMTACCSPDNVSIPALKERSRRRNPRSSMPPSPVDLRNGDEANLPLSFTSLTRGLTNWLKKSSQPAERAGTRAEPALHRTVRDDRDNIVYTLGPPDSPKPPMDFWP
ncbi:hypothetical protein NMY22_g4991 [Coprinellus aureogranulatus]|nr:hypothetical protein NMY22_g4991 [Coprinellus aureogranulatus]